MLVSPNGGGYCHCLNHTGSRCRDCWSRLALGARFALPWTHGIMVYEGLMGDESRKTNARHRTHGPPPLLSCTFEVGCSTLHAACLSCVAVLLVVLPTASPAAEAGAVKALADCFPASNDLPGWVRLEEPAVYEGKAMYDYMDGAAEIPMSYGCRGLASATYSKAGANIEVTIFDMPDALAAFGYFSIRDRSPKDKWLDVLFGEVQRRTYHVAGNALVTLDLLCPDRLCRTAGGGVLAGWKGKRTFVVTAKRAEVSGKTVETFGTHVWKRIVSRPDERVPDMSLPTVFAHESFRYVRGRPAFDAAVAFFDGNPLRVNGKVDAFAVDNPIPAAPCTYVLVRYPAVQDAERALATLLGRIEAKANEEFPVGVDAEGKFFSGFRQEGMLWLVVGANDRSTASRALRALKDGAGSGARQGDTRQ